MIRKFFFSLTLFLVLAVGFFDWQFKQSPDPYWGLNFSITHAQYLGFDWKKMFQEMLDDLKPKRLRIMALWETIEQEQGKFIFDDLDYILRQGVERDIKIIVSIGHKQPGWPECHHPDWYNKLTTYQQDEAQLAMVRQTVLHLKKFNSVSAWQVENEPFFVFGPDCPAISKDLLARGIALLRILDPRPIILTDSGEKGWWLPTARFGADVFGSTMYRKIYHAKRQKYVQYFVPPIWYRIKGGMLRYFFDIDRVIGVELQAEPWYESDVFSTPWEKQKALMNGAILNEYVDYASRAGLAENYFWGVEWWYYGKEKFNDPEMWETAKEILNPKPFLFFRQPEVPQRISGIMRDSSATMPQNDSAFHLGFRY